MKIKEISKEVYVSDDLIVKVGRQDIDFLKSKVSDTERKRIRLCAHKNVDDKLHEMFIALSKETYVRPHKHINKAESLHVMEGLVDVFFFDEAGNISEIVPLGDYLSGRQFFYRIAGPIYHTLVIRSDVLVFHETTEGPFIRANTVFAPWSPEDHNSAAITEFISNLSKLVLR